MNIPALMRRPSRLLVGIHIAACLLFLVLVEPMPREWQADLDREREGLRDAHGLSISTNSAVMGHVACRTLGSWSKFHGGEAFGVKVLEVLNLPAIVPTVLVSVVVDSEVLHYRLSFCQSSWLDAGIFLLLSCFQWYLVGRAIEELVRAHHAPTSTVGV